jgi:hypothetical protein
MQAKDRRELIASLADGRYASEIAKIVGCRTKYVHKILNRPEYKHLQRPKVGPPRGDLNPAWTGGRVIQRCGRVLSPAPTGHPLARIYSYKKIGRVLEHRLVMEKTLGRFLEEKEVVDHIDGCVLHNDPKNLRVFESNAEHLRATITGLPHDVHSTGREALKSENKSLPGRKRWSRYKEMWRVGDARLLQILHAHLLLDRDSPYLLGTQRYLALAQIDPSSRENLKDALIHLCLKWELTHKMSALKHLL